MAKILQNTPKYQKCFPQLKRVLIYGFATSLPVNWIFWRQWITTTVFSPNTWSVFNQPVRTNNNVEGWHNLVNSRGSAKINLYDLRKLLHEEANLAALYKDLLCAKNIKTVQSTSAQSYECKLQQLWKKYKPRTGRNVSRISTEELLTQTAELYFSMFSVSFLPDKDDLKDELDSEPSIGETDSDKDLNQDSVAESSIFCKSDSDTETEWFNFFHWHILHELYF